MELKFTKENIRDMYNIFLDIHSSLKDKSTNTNHYDLGIYELGLLQSIDKRLTEIDYQVLHE